MNSHSAQEFFSIFTHHFVIYVIVQYPLSGAENGKNSLTGRYADTISWENISIEMIRKKEWPEPDVKRG